MILILILSIISAICYRLGGWGAPGKKYLPGWMVDTKMRDVGCSILAIITAIICGVHAAWYAHLLVFGLQWGALSTYCKFGKQPDVYWYNWLCAGLFCGFSSIFYVIFGDVSWLEFGIRMIATGIGFWAWSVLIGWDVAEEAGRGFIFNISIRLLTLIK